MVFGIPVQKNLDIVSPDRITSNIALTVRVPNVDCAQSNADLLLEDIESASNSADMAKPQSMWNVQTKVDQVCITLVIALDDNELSINNGNKLKSKFSMFFLNTNVAPHHTGDCASSSTIRDASTVSKWWAVLAVVAALALVGGAGVALLLL
ncbi:hypothetical protein Pelo_1950 [Pelomyxa schiedti]|nr:hypothetical protein Pelo_1950 [Pelomyxa schiedti]